MKKVLSIIVLLMAIQTPAKVHAQRFEWAKGIGGQQNTEIFGAVTDSLGNLYIAAGFKGEAKWGEELLIPSEESLPTSIRSFLLAKITPDGEMAWKKTMQTINRLENVPYGLKMIGDTALMCYANVSTPSYGVTNVWWNFLGTLIHDANDNPFRFDSSYIIDLSAFLLFDLDGNLIDKHFIGMSYVDTNGMDDIAGPASYGRILRLWSFGLSSFDMDERGNIYIACEPAYGSMYTRSVDGQKYATVSAKKIWIDGHLAGVVDAHPQDYVKQVIKISPDFDTVLGSCYIYQKREPYGMSGITRPCIKVDRYSNVYVLSELSSASVMGEDGVSIASDATIVVDSAAGMTITVKDLTVSRTLVSIFDTSLNLKGFVTYEDSILSDSPSAHIGLRNEPLGISFDYDSNLFFVASNGGQSSYCDTSAYRSVLKYRGTPIDIKSNAFFASFEINTFPPVLHSWSQPLSLVASRANQVREVWDNMVSEKGRAMFQARYAGQVVFPEREFRHPNNHWSMGTAIYDYYGQKIDLIDLSVWANGESDICQESLLMHDSVLFMMNLVGKHLTFGNRTYVPQDHDAVIAKYVDTAFMRPHVATLNVGLPQQPAMEEGSITVWPNPATGMITIGLSEQCSEPKVDVLSLDGRLMLTAVGTRINVASLPQGVYILRVATQRSVSTARIVRL